MSGKNKKNNCSAFKPTAPTKRAKATLDLINRLQAENERLKKEFLEQKLKNNMLYETAKEIEIKAYKEFADLSIKRICEEVSAPTPSESYIVEKCNQTIYNLLKELVGDNK